MPLCASQGFSSPSARLGPAGGVEGPLRAFGARELASVSSVHSLTGETGVALLRRTPATILCPDWLSQSGQVFLSA